jgi:hypothetical protein
MPRGVAARCHPAAAFRESQLGSWDCGWNQLSAITGIGTGPARQFLLKSSSLPLIPQKRDRATTGPQIHALLIHQAWRRAMARFYFHVMTDDESIWDDEGGEFPDIGASHRHALRIINECLPYVQDDRRRWWVEIADGTGRTLLTVLYPNAYALAFAAAIDWRRAWFTYASFKG